MSKSLIASVLKAGVVLLLFLLALETSIAFYPPCYVIWLGIIGRNPLCGLGEAFRAARRYRCFREMISPQEAVQLIQRDKQGFALWSTSLGQFWITTDSQAVLSILVAQQQSNIYGFDSDTRVRRGDIVLDCGAHVGVFTRKALQLGAGMVVAIEPAPENLECLRRNFSREISTGQVIVCPEGVWDKEDVLTLYTYRRNSAGDSFLIDNQGADVEETKAPLTTLDKIVRKLGLERVDFIKMDIKGAVMRALVGATHTLAIQRPKLVISTEEEGVSPLAIQSAVLAIQKGYRVKCGMCAIESNLVRPNELFFY